MTTYPPQRPAPQDIATTVEAEAHPSLTKAIQVELEMPDPPSHVGAQIIAENTESASGPA